MLSESLNVVAPELVLAVFSMAALMWGAYAPREVGSSVLWAACVLLVLVGLWVGFQPEGARTAFDGSFVSDGFARFSKVLILFSAAAALAMSHDYLVKTGLMKFEFPVLVVLSVAGMMIMASAQDLMVLYLGLELQNLALYVIAAFRRDSLRSTEAGLKYFVLGALSSGLILYGASLTYGFAGTTGFSGIAAAGAGEHLAAGLVFGLVFLAAGIAFKVAAVPFHMWTPDVYEGSPTPVTAYFSTAPKVAGAVLFARLLYDAFGAAVGDWQQILVVLSLGSMFLGAVGAIGQRNFKRLMGYSSITHMGFALMGLAAGTAEGAQALLIYLAIYVTMNTGTFVFILNMERDGRPVTDFYELGLYSRVEPARALALAILLFSLAGVPPLVGFFGKFYVLVAAVNAGLVWLAVAGVVASVIGAFYYIRIVYIMYFGEASEPLDGRMPALHWALLAVSAIAMVAGVVNLFGVEGLAASAAATLVQ